MNCFNHPQEISVATCQDCNKGLCNECAIEYELPICKNCNRLRAKSEKTNIIKSYLILFGVGIVLCYVLKSLINRADGLPLFLYYACFASVAGWRFLNKITPNYFMFLSLFGWLIYFWFKAILSYIVGIFVFPYILYKDIKRWYELKNIN